MAATAVRPCSLSKASCFTPNPTLTRSSDPQLGTRLRSSHGIARFTKQVMAPSRTATRECSRQHIGARASHRNLPIYQPGWTALRGKDDWKGLAPTVEDQYIDAALKKEITLYGEAAQATYDTVDLRDWSRYRDQNRFEEKNLLHDSHLKNEFFFAELPGKGYKVEKGGFLRASERSQIVSSLSQTGQVQEDHVWIGYVAYSEERKDILVAWRGTQRPAEWIADATLDQIAYAPYTDPSYHDGPEPPNPPPAKLPVLKKLWPFAAAILWLSPALLFFAARTLPSKFPAGLVSFAASFERQVRAPSSGYPATALVALWAAIPVIFRRLGYSFIAGGAATVLGILPLLPSATVICAVGKFLPRFQAGGLVTLLATFPLAFLAAIPVAELFNRRGQKWYAGYAALSSAASVWVSCQYPGSVYRALGVLLFFVFVPLAVTSGQAAWAGSIVKEACVHEGFFELYNKAPSNPDALAGGDLMEAEKGSPRDTLHKAVRRLLDAHPECETISVSGHSLGAALAILSAFDLVKSGTNECARHYVPVTCYSFEGPRVGNMTFDDEFRAAKKQGLTAIRVVNKPDIVTQVPKALFLQNVYYCVGAAHNFYWLCGAINWVENVSYALRLPSAYKHVGVKITMDSRQIDYIQQMKGSNPMNNAKHISTYHNLEVALHVLSGYSETKPYGAAFDRDFPLINKISDALDPRFGISPNWLDSLTPNVTRANPGGALIQPYNEPILDGEPSDVGTPTNRHGAGDTDNDRMIGYGPGYPAWPLCKDYIKRYMTHGNTPVPEGALVTH